MFILIIGGVEYLENKPKSPNIVVDPDKELKGFILEKAAVEAKAAAAAAAAVATTAAIAEAKAAAEVTQSLNSNIPSHEDPERPVARAIFRSAVYDLDTLAKSTDRESPEYHLTETVFLAKIAAGVNLAKDFEYGSPNPESVVLFGEYIANNVRAGNFTEAVRLFDEFMNYLGFGEINHITTTNNPVEQEPKPTPNMEGKTMTDHRVIQISDSTVAAYDNRGNNTVEDLERLLGIDIEVVSAPIHQIYRTNPEFQFAANLESLIQQADHLGIDISRYINLDDDVLDSDEVSSIKDNAFASLGVEASEANSAVNGFINGSIRSGQAVSEIRDALRGQDLFHFWDSVGSLDGSSLAITPDSRHQEATKLGHSAYTALKMFLIENYGEEVAENILLNSADVHINDAISLQRHVNHEPGFAYDTVRKAAGNVDGKKGITQSDVDQILALLGINQTLRIYGRYPVY